MASKDTLQNLKKLISTGAYQDALVICKDELRDNPAIFEYNLFAGKCACELKHYEESQRYYKSAHAARKTALQPFHGLVQLYRRSGAYDQQADALRHILSHSSVDEASVHNTRIELANALLNSNQAEEAWHVIVAIEDGLQSALGVDEAFELPRDVAVLKADCQMKLDETEYNSRLRQTLAEAHKGANGTQNTDDDDVLTQRVAAKWAEELLARPEDAIQTLAARAGADPRLTKYHLEMLKRSMAMILGAPAGSAERHERRAAALRMCFDVVDRGGCISTEPYELALRLLEVEEEVAAHTATDVHSTTGDTVAAHTLGTRLPSNAMCLQSLPSMDNFPGPGEHSAAGSTAQHGAAGSTVQHGAPAPGSLPGTASLTLTTQAPAALQASPAPFPASPAARTSVVTAPPAPGYASATAGSNLDRLLAGMPLIPSASSIATADNDGHSGAIGAAAGMPSSPMRPGRVTAPAANFGPTDLASLSSVSSTPRHPSACAVGGGGGGLLTQALTGHREGSWSRLPTVGAGGSGESASVEAGAVDGQEGSIAGRATIVSMTGTAAGSAAAGLVRYASRVRDDYSDSEVIPVVGSYELRALSRSYTGPSGAAGLHPSHRSLPGEPHHHLGTGINAVYPPDLVSPDHPGPTLPHSGSFSGRGHSVSRGAHVLPRRASFGSSDAFGGGASAMSIAGSDEDTPSHTRFALPPLASLPRVSRDASNTAAASTPHGSQAATVPPLTPHATPHAAGHHPGHHYGPRSPSASAAISRAPSMISRASGSFVGSQFAPTRYVPGVEEDAVPVGQLGMLEDMERFAARLTHISPSNPAGQVHLAMALLRRAPELQQSAQQLQRPRIIRMLRSALARGVPTAAGWLCLSELYRKEGSPKEALSASRQGLQYVNQRARSSREQMTQAGLALRLEAAQALLALGHHEEAADAFSLLKAWTSEGEITFPYMAGIMPVSIRQHAARGLAQVAAARGDRAAAKRQYERLLGKALRGLGPSEHWAHGEYGWLLFADGDAAGAQHHLHAAIEVAAMADADPAHVADYHFKLGRVLWEKDGGPSAEEQAAAYDAFLHAASLDGPAQAAAFTFLGHYFRDARAEEMKARKCYRRALELDAQQAAAGVALCDLLHESNCEDLVHGVCCEILAACPAAEWAQRRLGLHHLWMERPREAIKELQAALRMDGEVAEAWEALGAAYERIGRLTAALKAYERAVDIDGTRVYALAQGAAISSVMGDTESALAMIERALALDPKNPAVLLCETQTRCQLAAVYSSLGAAALAAESLRLGAEAATRAVRANGTLEATWKSLGDCRIRQARLPAASQPPVAAVLAGELDGAPGGPAAALLAAHRGRTDAARAAQRAYAAAVHLNPLRPASWSDLALTQHQIAALGAEHPAAHDAAAETAARATAERVLLAALRLAPDVAGLWSALGSVHSAPGKREYALRRALQLDPADAMTWLKLGRLYHAHNMSDKVTACYDAARSADPKLAAVWEAMAAFEATRAPEATLNTIDGAETHGLAKHALHLHGGAEAALTFAYGALQDPSAPRNGILRGAANGAVVAQPLNAAAYHTLALAMEASGAPNAAVCALRAARALHAAAAAAPPASVPGAPLIAATWRGLSKDECMSLDLARALTVAGECEEACVLYEELDTAERPLKSAYALLAYALARGGGKQLDAGLLQRAMDAAMSAEEVASVATAAVSAAASGGGGYAAASAAAKWAAPRLQQWGGGGEAARAVARGTAVAHLGTLATAARSGTDKEYAAARSAAVAAVYRMHAPVDDKTDVSERDVLQKAAADIEVCAAVHAADACAARRAATRAVHLCPWSAVHRDIAVCAAASDPTAPAHAVRLTAANRASPGAEQEDALAAAAVDAVAEVHLRHAGLPPLRGTAGSSADGLADGVRAAKAALMRDPRQVRTYVTLGAVLAQRAVLCGGAGAASAVRACMHATHALAVDNQADAGGESAVLRVHALLACAIAESAGAAAEDEQATQHSRGAGRVDDPDTAAAQPPAVANGGDPDSKRDRHGASAALEAAQRALSDAEHSSVGAGLKAACIRQVARCQRLLGNHAAAESALRHGADLGDAVSSILLARLLIASGRAAEVSGAGEASGPDQCVEWLQARKIAEVEAACVVGDLERAKEAAAGLEDGGRAPQVASALVAVGLQAQVPAAGGGEVAADVKQQLSQVRRHGQLALAGCQRADVAVVAALALAESEGRRAKADAQTQWARVAAAAAQQLPGTAAERDEGEGMDGEEEAVWASVRVRLVSDAAA
eukprot:jgi/Ulvmu1/9938/UM058_0021.1